MKKIISLILVLTMGLGMALPIFANSFTPSAETKYGSILVTVTDQKTGESYVGVGVDKDGNEIEGTRIKVGDLMNTLIPGLDDSIKDDTLSYQDRVTLLENRKKTQEVYRAFKNANNVFEEVGENDVLDKKKDHAVTMLFDLTAVREGADIVDEIFEQDGYLEVVFKFKTAPNPDLSVAVLVDDEWVFLTEDQITKNEDGTYTLRFTDICPIAVIQSTEATRVPPGQEAYIRIVKWVTDLLKRVFERKWWW